MDRQELCSELLAGLIDLEESGDIVITHSIPRSLADKLASIVIRHWASDFSEFPPPDLLIQDSLEMSSKFLSEEFGLSEPNARSTMEEFHNMLKSRRSATEVADLVAHQTSSEIALGAYYCVVLQRGEYYSSGYLDWRKEFYASKKAKASQGERKAPN